MEYRLETVEPAFAPPQASKTPGRPTVAKRRRSAPRSTLILFLGPALVALVAFRFLPATTLLSSATTDIDGRFVGLDNITFLLGLRQFQGSLVATAIFVLVTVPLQILAALALALLLNLRNRGVHIARSIVLVPVAIPQAVSAVIWGILLRPDGLGNQVIEAAGGEPQRFLTSPQQALPTMIFIVSWIGVGYWSLFLLAGMREIGGDIYDAAVVDGAGWRQITRSITIPLLRRPLLFVIVSDTIAAFLVFAPIAILTRGGPAGSTRLWMYDLYERAFIQGDAQLSSAQALIIVAVVAVIVSLQFRLLRGGAT